MAVASVLRREAVARLAAIAGYDDRLEVELTLARPRALGVLVRQALRVAAGDELLAGEVRALAPIAGGKAWVLDDVIHETGRLPSETPGEPMTLEDLERTIEEVLG